MYTRELPPKPPEDDSLIDQIGEYSRARTFEESDEAYQQLADRVKVVDLLEKSADVELKIAGIDKRSPRASEIPDMRARQQGYHTSAYAYFARTNGAYDRVAQGEDPEEIHREMWNKFQGLKKLYDGPEKEKYAARADYKRQLAGNFAALVVLDEESYIQRLTTSERTTPYPRYLGEGNYDKRESTLDTRAKLIGLRDDPRARFLPATHREKNIALEALDYLDNPDYPNGIMDRLKEIYTRQVNTQLRQVSAAKKAARENGELYLGRSTEDAWAEGHEIAKDTVRSIIHEWGDFVANARYSMLELGALCELIETTDNPKLTLKDVLEEAGDLAPDAQPLLRFLALRDFRETGALPDPIFDPLRTRILREESMPGAKKKLVADVFLTPADEEHLGAYFESMKGTITIGQLRGGGKNLHHEAFIDSQRRFSFSRGLLSKVPEDSDYYPFAQEAIRMAA